MTYGEISEALTSISIARLFFEYGKLDTVLEAGFDGPDSDYYLMLWELLGSTADFVFSDYDENYGVNKWYFSNRDMVEYYRLCRTYGCLHELKLKDNPFMQSAERFVENAMDFSGQYGYGWYLSTKVSHEWASGIVFRTDEYFNGEFELLEALLSIGDWYKRNLVRLREAIEEKKLPAAAENREVMAA